MPSSSSCCRSPRTRTGSRRVSSRSRRSCGMLRPASPPRLGRRRWCATSAAVRRWCTWPTRSPASSRVCACVRVRGLHTVTHGRTVARTEVDQTRPELPSGSVLPVQLKQAELERVPRLVMEAVSTTPDGGLRTQAFRVRVRRDAYERRRSHAGGDGRVSGGCQAHTDWWDPGDLFRRGRDRHPASRSS
jgi:hypothetical protein